MDRNPSPPKELQNNEEIFHGDNVGQTAFSKHWLFTTLMKLIQEVDKHNEGKPDEETEFGVDVDEDLQNELCKLWDMTMNDEVAKFLIDFEAIGIFIGVIGKSKAPRVTEICVGVLGNMACCSDICKLMSTNDSLIKLMLLLLENTDAPTLVETTRLLLTCLSDSASRTPWLNAIDTSSNFSHHIKFILQSSTNSALLKNTGQLLDQLLDLEDDISSKWTTEDFVAAVLEAIKQIGLSDIEALEVFIHNFQLLSTSSEGVVSLVHHDMKIVEVIMGYLDQVCEDMFAIEDHLNGLSSSVSILSVFISSHDIFHYLMKDEKLIRVFLKVLEALNEVDTVLQHVSNGRRSIAGPEGGDNSESNPHSTKESSDKLDKTCVKTVSVDNALVMCDSKIADGNDRTSLSSINEHRDCSNSEQVQFLNQSITDLLFDISEFIYEKSEMTDQIPASTYLPIVTYLNTVCSRKRLASLIKALQQTNREKFDPVQVFFNVAELLKQNRLSAILSDALHGRQFSRSDSHRSTDSNPNS